MEPLRLRLQEITEGQHPAEHLHLIGALLPEFHHTIESEAIGTPINRYTCAMFALGIVEDEEYIAIVQVAPAYVFASMTFVQRLINRGLLVPRQVGQAGSLIVYFDEGRATHIGRMLAVDRVESKWGVGHHYTHGIMEVPAAYGSEVRFFEPINRDDVLDCFADYAAEHGVQFE